MEVEQSMEQAGLSTGSGILREHGSRNAGGDEFGLLLVHQKDDSLFVINQSTVDLPLAVHLKIMGKK